MKETGKVYLVGAGPGRPELLTLRGAECLVRADAVVLDALVNRRLLNHCRPGVQVIDAGKRGHGRVLMRQPQIDRLLVRLARRGKTVVRLKGGDPYFFGRGGEEAQFLSDHGVPFEVVPGVSSVNAVPAYAGVPLTHRGHASTVTVVTGHEGRENPYLRESARAARDRVGPGVDWDRLSPDGTLVILMGLRQLPEIIQKLRSAGWPLEKPVTVTQWGSWPQQKTLQGTLGDIVPRVKASGLGAPAVIVVGSVAGLRPSLNWFEKLPLFGRTVLVTRAPGQASSVVSRLESYGARVLESPLVRIAPLKTPAARLRKYLDIGAYDGVIFTSANAVRIFAGFWARIKKPWPAGAAVYAVGPRTARALLDAGLPVHAVAETFVAEGLRPLFKDAAGKKFLFPRARMGRDVLLDFLQSKKASVDLWPLYQTKPEKMTPEARTALLEGRVDAVTFTSSSTVHGLMGQLTKAARRRVFRKTLAASMGPITSRALRSQGVRPRIIAKAATAEDLADAIARHFEKTRR